MLRYRALFFIGCLLLGSCSTPSASPSNTPAPVDAGELRATIEAELRTTLEAEQTIAPATAQPSETVATTSTTPSPGAAAPTPSTTPVAALPGVTVEAVPAATTVLAASEPARFEPDNQGQQTVLNVQLVFDASGSMAEALGSETRIVAARRAAERVVAQLPTTNANMNVGFRVFGHRGDNTEAGKRESCGSTELLVPMTGINIELLRQQLNAWEPTGWTPISLALQQAGESFPQGENIRNVIIVVSDGEETCGGDPCAVAQALAASRAEVRIDLIGFGVTPDVAQTLQCISANSGGTYLDAQDGERLESSLQELIAASLQRSTLTIQTIDADGPTPDVIVNVFDERGADVTLTTAVDEVLGSAAPFADGRQRIEVPPGIVRIEITAINNRVSQIEKHRTTVYTARVVEGQNTDVVIGFGSLVVTSTDTSLRLDGSNRFRDIELQKQAAGRWETTLTQRFFPGEPFRLTPGVYRLVYHADGNERVVVDDIVIAPGKAITVEISGQ